MTTIEDITRKLRDLPPDALNEVEHFVEGLRPTRLVSINDIILEDAACLRAHVWLKTPDAIHAASALRAGAGLFVSNDPAFRRVPGLPVIILDDLLTP
jgi:predicted nucleic acid-binding protein